MAATGQRSRIGATSAVAPRSSLCPCYTSRNPQLLRTLHLRRQPILHCENRLAAVSPNYGRAFFGWGFAIFFCVFWGIAGFRGILQHPQKAWIP